jgi:hypothetical protein
MFLSGLYSSAKRYHSFPCFNSWRSTESSLLTVFGARPRSLRAFW